MAAPRRTDGKRRRMSSGGIANERPRVTDWIQALSGIMAVLFAAAALLVAAFTYRDQQQINRDQLTLNNAARQRAQQRFAARVAWWFEVVRRKEGAGLRILIQNRSPVPVRNIYFAVEAVSGLLIVTIDDLPPCAIRGYHVAVAIDEITGALMNSVHEGDLPVDLAYGIMGRNADLHFSDSEGYWTLTDRGLIPDEQYGLFRRAKKPDIVSSDIFEEIPALATTAADCGEGD